MRARETPLPDFYIVGAPKCGTTSLSSWLRDHPEVFVPETKEPHFFATDLKRRKYVTDRDAYLDLFAGAGPEHRAVGEASVFYLFSAAAVPAILEVRPDARLVVMLRNPLEMFPSLHGHYLFTFLEVERDPERAWRLEAPRRRGEVPLPPHCDEPRLLEYGRICALGEQVARLLGHTPAEQVHFVFYDDFAADPARCYRTCLDFLGLADDGQTCAGRANRARTHRAQWLGRLLWQPPAWVRSLAGGTRRRWPGTYRSLRARLHRLNRRDHTRRPLTVDFRRELAEHFADDVALLAEVTGRGLDHWLAGATPGVAEAAGR